MWQIQDAQLRGAMGVAPALLWGSDHGDAGAGDTHCSFPWSRAARGGSSLSWGTGHCCGYREGQVRVSAVGPSPGLDQQGQAAALMGSSTRSPGQSSFPGQGWPQPCPPCSGDCRSCFHTISSNPWLCWPWAGLKPPGARIFQGPSNGHPILFLQIDA